MFRILIDTCVWLDLAKDYRQRSLLGALEKLVRHGEVSLIVPHVVTDEVARNKSRIIEESTHSLSGSLKRVKEAVDKYGDPRGKRAILRQLNDIDHRLPTLGDAAAESIARIEKLFRAAVIIERQALRPTVGFG
jgi:PIN domain